MGSPLAKKFTLNDLRAARGSGAKVPMLTCYDYTTARLMQQAGVPMLLVGDSAGNVILGHDTTLPVPLHFMIQIAAAVRRGAPHALLVADMPFGSYHGSPARAVRNVFRMVQHSGCDCVKIEAAESQLHAIRELADAGVAIMAHLGLRPQAVGVLGGYRAQGRTAEDAEHIVELSVEMQRAGAAAILLEAVPAEVSAAVVEATRVPVIGCGAGPACHGHVVVTHDMINLTPRPPKFAPRLGDLATPMVECFAEYARRVSDGSYPAAEHGYTMPPEERSRLAENLAVQAFPAKSSAK
ncbi:MAG TPA: 3-methyl-2-oxobutanoate hydroxymethyltransferase [Tepidisphaeraceae bacterium]|nr:3-methyl-2-oxobutanoate hydroxymethyltransferase [Tepidisphaeraceae bacterium]